MASKAKIRAVAGMNDMLPMDSAIWEFFEKKKLRMGTRHRQLMDMD